MNVEFTDASPASEVDETNVTETATDPNAEASTKDANTADSSDAGNEDAKQEPETLLSVIRDVVEKKDGTEDSSPPEGKQEEGQKAEGEAEAKSEEEGQSEADVPFHNHPRWKEIVAERNALREDSQSFHAITGFMQSNGLSGEEVAEGFEIMALLKSGDQGSLTKARDWFAERLQGLNEHLGDVLPADLQAKVDSGETDVEIARELARSRAQAKHFETRTAEQQRQDQEREARDRAYTQAKTVAQAVSDWETGIKAKDPDYAAKAKLVESQALAIIAREGKRPQTKEEAVDLVTRAYGEVGEMMKSFAPKPKAVKPTPAGLSARASTAPKSLREAIDAAVNR